MKYTITQKRLFLAAAARVIADRNSPGDAIHWARNVINLLRGQL